jgi:hypothetical protein
MEKREEFQKYYQRQKKHRFKIGLKGGLKKKVIIASEKEKKKKHDYIVSEAPNLLNS